MISAARNRTRETPSLSAVSPERRPIPFDYTFRYELTGEPGNVIGSIVTVSIESIFTATSIGYGVIPKVQPIIFGLAPPPPPVGVIGRGIPLVARRTLNSITLGEMFASLDPKLVETSRVLRNETGPEAVFKGGIRLNPDITELALADNGNAPLPDNVIERLFQVVGAPSDLVQFKYAIFDAGSGREFQSEPILNIAGLGSADGKRPFRYFARPITFAPRATIRMEVTEVSDFEGELHVALHGYKVLGDPNSPTDVSQRRAARRATR